MWRRKGWRLATELAVSECTHLLSSVHFSTFTFRLYLPLPACTRISLSGLPAFVAITMSCMDEDSSLRAQELGLRIEDSNAVVVQNVSTSSTTNQLLTKNGF